MKYRVVRVRCPETRRLSEVEWFIVEKKTWFGWRSACDSIFVHQEAAFQWIADAEEFGYPRREEREVVEMVGRLSEKGCE